MINSIIQFSLKNKLIIILLTLTIAGFGLYSTLKIPVGAVPDITNNQVQVITTSRNLSTQDVEQFITYPVELEMSNLPGVKEIRSVSKFGLSVVTIVFDEDLGTYLPRQLIAEKLKTAAANIPEGFGEPEMGPISTGLGEIYQYVLDVKPGYEQQYSITDLRTIQDWYVKRQLSGIPGVVEINTWGGYLKQYEVAVNPHKLAQYQLSIADVFNALEESNAVAGGAYIEKDNRSYFVRGEGLLKSIAEIEQIPINTHNGIALKVKDVASVGYGHANRFGAITANGQGEKVMGQIMMLKDANSNQVISDVKKRVEEVQQHLPEGVFINPIVERSELISKTTATILENLIFGCLIVFLVVLLILGNLRASLVISSLIPLSLLFTISAMYVFGIDANLMSLGALDFGIIIDGAVIITEFIVLKLTQNATKIGTLKNGEQSALIDEIAFTGTSKMMNSAIFGQIIILIVFIPILSLTGVEGKMFRPMALSFSFALLGAMFFGFTWLPVAASLFLRPQRKEWPVTRWIMKLLNNSYRPVITWAYDHKRWVLGSALVMLVFSGWLFTRLGAEFVPTLDEGDFVIQPVLKTGTSLDRTIQMTTMMENILIDKFPEVEKVVSRIGAAEVPTDPMSMEEIDMIIKLKPKKIWVTAGSKEELANKFKEALSVIPNVEYEFTQPIEMRFNELITGVRADLAIKIFGEDLDVLNRKAMEVGKLINGVPGAADIIIEKTAGLPQIGIKYRRDMLSKYGVTVQYINNSISTAFAGATAGSIFEGEKRFDLVVRLDKNFRSDIENIRMLGIRLSNGKVIPLKELAQVDYSKGPAKISRDNTHRRVVVSVNVRNRDLESVVKDIQNILSAKLKLPAGYYVEYGGQFENLRNARSRLVFAVPIALALIFIFLHFAFHSLMDAIMVYTAVPLSVIGGILLLWIRGMPFSISAGVGFIALFGVAVLNGIVLIEHLKELKEQGVSDLRERVMQATHDRLRPVMLTASAAAMGFLPMAISTSAGAEVQRPLATVVIGGLITSTLLTMIVLPLLYAVFERIKERRNGKAKRFVFFSILMLGLFITPLKGSSQEVELSLENVVALALQNNSGVKAAASKVEMYKALYPAAVNIPRTDFYYGYDQNNIAENEHPLKVYGVQQSFSLPSVYGKQLKLAKMDRELAELELEVLKNRLIRDVSITYNKVLYYMNLKQLLDSMNIQFTRLQQAAEKNFATGNTSKIELYNAMAKHQSFLVEFKQVEMALSGSLSELKGLIQSDSLYAILPQQLIPVEINIDATLMLNSSVSIYQRMIDYSKLQVSIEKQQFLPEINLEVFNGTNNFPGSKNYLGYQVGLSLPIFFNSQKSKVKSKKLEVEVNTALYTDYVKRYKSAYASAQTSYYSSKELLSSYITNVLPVISGLTKTTQELLATGNQNVFEFIRSLETVYELQRKYLETIYNYNNSAFELKYFTF